eukprot:m.181020 g.181020  ORF g.181020 m.181020 type:complete len:63 (-) comp15375_c0_seq20:2303-2491(-)
MYEERITAASVSPTPTHTLNHTYAEPHTHITCAHITPRLWTGQESLHRDAAPGSTAGSECHA